MLKIKGTNAIAVARSIDFLTTAFILLTLIDFGSAIRCFRCSVTVEQHYENDTVVSTPICLKFDRSYEYIADCPYSTMCLKTISTLTLNNGQEREVVTRGCAQQKHSTEVFQNRSWHTKYSVKEVYSEGCTGNTGNNLVGAALKYCYCRGDLCNSSSRLHVDVMLFLMPTLAVIMLSKIFLKTKI